VLYVSTLLVTGIFHQQQRQSEITYPGQESVQRGLIGDNANQCGCLRGGRHGHVVEPLRSLRIQAALHNNPVLRRATQIETDADSVIL
jgi:hypothetical protein